MHGIPFVFCNTLVRFSMSCFVQKKFALSLEVVEKRTNVNVFWPNFWRETTPTFPRQTVSAINCPSPFGKVWLSSVCRCLSAKPGNQVLYAEFTEGGKNDGPVLSHMCTKVHDALRRCIGDFLYSSNACTCPISGVFKGAWSNGSPKIFWRLNVVSKGA